MTQAFEIYPAIDLRGGHVVRLSEGDPARQTRYSDDPGAAAQRFIDEGARWLHVVNLDAAFGEDDTANLQAVTALLRVASRGTGVPVQLGGGVRSLERVDELLALGVRRVVLGTVAAEHPELVAQAAARCGGERIAVGLDARGGRVRVRGWTADAGVTLLELALRLRDAGAGALIYTDIARDGLQRGVDADTARTLADETAMPVIASGGVATLEDLRRVRGAGLAGVIVGRALYEGRFSLAEALAC